MHNNIQPLLPPPPSITPRLWSMSMVYLKLPKPKNAHTHHPTPYLPAILILTVSPKQQQQGQQRRRSGQHTYNYNTHINIQYLIQAKGHCQTKPKREYPNIFQFFLIPNSRKMPLTERKKSHLPHNISPASYTLTFFCRSMLQYIPPPSFSSTPSSGHAKTKSSRSPHYVSSCMPPPGSGKHRWS